MLDNTTSLAYSIFNNRGVYALLLGSGVSRDAGIPTGWEITLDLIRKVANAEGVDAGNDPVEWLQQSKCMAPDYSSLLDQLARTPSERRSVLARYIEADEEERAGGRKLPTAAHRAIADMVRSGYIRVIVTTNFDRLLEIALRDAGVEPTVVSSDDSAHGAEPAKRSSESTAVTSSLKSTRPSSVNMKTRLPESRISLENQSLGAYWLRGGLSGSNLVPEKSILRR